MSDQSVPEPSTVGDGGDGDNETDGDDLRDVLGMGARRAPAMLKLDQVIDDAYRIEEELGAGGMGRVYRAHDLRLDRDIALKLHAVALAPDDDSLRREATALARLAHPNVVTVYEVGSWSGHPWVAMEYVPGGNARTWAAAAPRSTREVLTLYLAAGVGLAAAHEAGLVHRDFKPDNVLVGADGRARVADFGLARSVATPPETHDEHASDDPLKTRSGAVRGTPAYMAPEQRTGGAVDAAADQFAFAVALWEALTSQRPFDDADPLTIRKPPPGKLPAHVEAALRRALSVAPKERWPSMHALLYELSRDPARRRRKILVAAVAGVALAGASWIIVRAREARGVACELDRDELATAWSPGRRDALRAGVRDPVVGGRVTTLLDDWARRYTLARQAACAATHVDHRQSEAMLDLRNGCLDRARGGSAPPSTCSRPSTPRPTRRSTPPPRYRASRSALTRSRSPVARSRRPSPGRSWPPLPPMRCSLEPARSAWPGSASPRSPRRARRWRTPTRSSARQPRHVHASSSPRTWPRPASSTACSSCSNRPRCSRRRPRMTASSRSHG
ncbi:MAG: protein kinase [Myxococcales bacterium]|nr:protein kinase [Myxococcales bacterium]